ncbi:MAG: DUF3592 domain-containing protein, partial [Gallionellaceae bacterium]
MKNLNLMTTNLPPKITAPKKEPLSKKEWGIIFLMASPFILGGLALLYGTFSHFSTAFDVALTWNKVDAHIVTAYARKKSNGNESTHYIHAKYYYEVNGIQYDRTRVGIVDEGGFGLSFSLREKILLKNRGRNTSFPAYVNPSDAGDSMLFATPVWDVVLSKVLIGIIFGGIGVAGLYLLRKGDRTTQKEIELEKRYPREPWKWKENWEMGQLKSLSGAMTWVWWCIAFFWNILSAPIFFILPGEIEDGNFLALLGLIFPLVGVYFLITAIRSTSNSILYGNTTLDLVTHPGKVGGEFQAIIVLNRSIILLGEITLKLTCIQQMKEEKLNNKTL